jgi:hypothetical protein
MRIKMKTISRYICALLFTGFIYGTGFMVQHHCFSEDNPFADSPLKYKEPTSDFRQLTNQELYEEFREMIESTPEPPRYRSKEYFLKGEQGSHNYYLRKLLGYEDPNAPAEIRTKPDMNE